MVDINNNTLPKVRIRRNKHSSWIREIISETKLTTQDLILPLFVVEGQKIQQPIDLMPNIHKLSIDNLILHAKQAEKLGIKAIALFPSLDKNVKSINAEEAYSPDNLICRAIKSLKDSGLEIGIIVDVALDPFTLSGHDGILTKNHYVDNELTVEILVKQALVYAEAGADVLAPSDMMDGRVLAIRKILECHNKLNVNIFSYSAKYCSNFYSPFRNALNVQSKIPLDKKTYQLDIRNYQDAMDKIKIDFREGADMVIIKPSLLYLDIIQRALAISTNILAFQVSGEYSMIRYAALANALNWKEAILESLISTKRAGVKAILCYAANEVAEYLNNLD